MYVRSRQVAQVCNSCVMRILEPRLKGDLKISFYRVVEEGFHKHLARVYARRIWAFLFFPLLCVLFSFFLFLYTQCCETHNCRQRQSDVRMIIYDHVRPISSSFASNEKIYIQHFIHHHPVSFQCAKKIPSRSKRCRLLRWNELIRETFVQRSNSNRFPNREEFSKGGITTCIHIWNSGLYPRGSLCRFSSGISRDLRPGEGGRERVRVGITSVWIARNTL